MERKKEKKKKRKKIGKYKGIGGTKKKDTQITPKTEKSTSSWFSQTQKCPKVLIWDIKLNANTSC